MASDTHSPHAPLSSQPFLWQTSHPSSDPHPVDPSEEISLETPSMDTTLKPASTQTPDERVVKQIHHWTRFVSLAVQVDLPDSNEVPGELHSALVSVLKSTAKKHKGIWFHWKGPLYGCALPDFSADQARDAALTVQRKLASKRPETVTIGIAPYPMLIFDGSQTLSNACKALDHAAFFGPGGTAVFNAVTLNISGDRYYQNGQIKSAISEYEDALRINAQDINVQNSLGVCWAELKELTKSRECFQAVLAMEPGEIMATYNLGMVHLFEKNQEKALALFKKAFARNTKTFQIPYQIGKVLMKQKQFAKAKPYLEHAVLLRPDSSSALCLIGYCLAKEKKIPEAIKTLKKAVKINPNDASALSALGGLYDKKGENPEICLTFSRQSVSLAPRNATFRFRLASLYQKYGFPDQAREEYNKASDLGYDCRKKLDELEGCTKTDQGKRSTQCA
jgi:tetratricopeptide (TPR) repeat protein